MNLFILSSLLQTYLLKATTTTDMSLTFSLYKMQTNICANMNMYICLQMQMSSSRSLYIRFESLIDLIGEKKRTQSKLSLARSEKKSFNSSFSSFFFHDPKELELRRLFAFCCVQKF